MPHETMTLFFAMLAVLLAVASVAVVALLVWDRVDRGGQAGELLSRVQPAAVALAALVATVCTAGSLYLSEVVGYEPCRLCWVQRGFMYPAAAVLVLAAAVNNRLLALAGGALAAIGLPVAIFHRYEQATGSGSFCDPDNPCSIRWLNHFGFVTIPTMAAVGFVGILVLVGLHLFWRNDDRYIEVSEDVEEGEGVEVG